MVVGPDAALPLPWLAAPLARALALQRGHALLLHAAPGVGALQFALALAQAWLCEGAGAGEDDAAKRPCGRCGSCRLVQSHVHPDLCVLLPETLRREHAWLLADDKPDSDDAKRKPSRQIRIDEVRGMIGWTWRTSARGRGKAALLHPAEALNLQSANALLKTLEEPPAGTRIVLTATDPAVLLPTVRSRCQVLRLAPPAADVAVAWLSAQGSMSSRDAAVLLAASGGRPLDALALAQSGIDGAVWSALPAAVARGHAGALAGWPLPRALDALHKLCHDAQVRAQRGSARYFPNAAVPSGGQPALLANWGRTLNRVARHDEHPWHDALLLEALIAAGARALAPLAIGPARPAPRGFDTLHR